MSLKPMKAFHKASFPQIHIHLAPVLKSRMGIMYWNLYELCSQDMIRNTFYNNAADLYHCMPKHDINLTH